MQETAKTTFLIITFLNNFIYTSSINNDDFSSEKNLDEEMPSVETEMNSQNLTNTRSATYKSTEYIKKIMNH